MALQFLNNGYFAGNVGIGVTGPVEKLQVDGNIAFSQGGEVMGQINTLFERLEFKVKDGVSASTAVAMTLRDYGSGPRLGIGTTSPDTRLNLEGVKNTSIITLGSTTNDTSWSVGDQYGAINFYSADGSGAGAGVKASISYEVSAGSSGTTNALVFNTAGIATGTNNTERMRIDAFGAVKFNAYNSTNNIGTATYLLGTDAAGNVVKTSAAPSANFNQGAKTHTVGTAFSNVLTVALSSHQGCYVTLCCFGDWGGHSSAAYRGEFFLQNGAGIYNEPGIIIRQDDNTSDGTDQIICQILDPGGSTGSRNFIIQIRHTDTTSPANFTGTITFTVQGQFNSVT